VRGLSFKDPLKDLKVSSNSPISLRRKLSYKRQTRATPKDDRYFENLQSHDGMTRMAQVLFNLMATPPEILRREARETVIGRRRFLDLDVQASDGSWSLRRIYIRAQPSREIYRCDIPFNTRSKSDIPFNTRSKSKPSPQNCNENVKEPSRKSSPGCSERARDRSARRPVLIAPRSSTSAGKLIVERGITFWRCFKVWKPRLRSQACLDGCEISQDWSEVMGGFAVEVKRFFDSVAARIRREGWGSPTSQKKEGPERAVSLVEFLRPEPWPPPPWPSPAGSSELR